MVFRLCSEVGIYKRKILRKKGNMLSTKEIVRFQEQKTEKAFDQEKRK